MTRKGGGGSWPSVGLLLGLAALLFSASAAAATISNVKVTPAFFNPSIGKMASISMQVSDAGSLEVEIVDRDGFRIRRLPAQEVKVGQVVLKWDGKDDAGTVVPDEAYFCRIDLTARSGHATYDPLKSFVATKESIGQCTYSRLDGILAYSLPWPARVHVQAGQATTNPETQRPEGPVLKTIVDRLPRPAGQVVETWNGFEDTGRVYVADLPNFAISIAATRLPDTPILTVGNQVADYLPYSEHRRSRPGPPSESTREGAPQGGGSDWQQDHSPRLRVEPSLIWDQAAHAHVGPHGPLEVVATLDPTRVPHFLTPQARVVVFLDEVRLASEEAPESPKRVTIPADQLRPGAHRIVVNWVSGDRPVAVGVASIKITGDQPPEKLGAGHSGSDHD